MEQALTIRARSFLYELLRERLPQSAIVSTAQRSPGTTIASSRSSRTSLVASAPA
jgi:hypothetical protein